MTLDDRLDLIAERSFVVNCHSEYDKDATKSDNDYYKVKQAILSDLQEIIGEDENSKVEEQYASPQPTVDEHYRNQLRAELRDKVKEYCK